MVYPGLFNASYTPAPLEVSFILNPAGYLGPYLFAVMFSFMLGGLIVAQATRYFTTFRHADPRGLQIHVLLVLALTALKLAQVAAVGYLDFSKYYGDYLFLTHKHWTLHVSVLAATLVSATVQVYFIRRCFLLSQRSYFVLVPILLTWFASIVSAIWVTVVFPTEWASRSPSFVIAGRVAPACTLAVDALITGFTAWFLARARTAFPGESPVARLLRVTLESAAPPLVTAIANVAYDDQRFGGYVFLWVAMTPLLQVMSMLYALNSRQYFRTGNDAPSAKTLPMQQSRMHERTLPRTPHSLGSLETSPFAAQQATSPFSASTFRMGPMDGDAALHPPYKFERDLEAMPLREERSPFTPMSADTAVDAESPKGPWKIVQD